MKTSVFLALCLLLASAGRPLRAQQAGQDQVPPEVRASGGLLAAQTAVDVWLGLADDAQYTRCWRTTATIFQQAVPLERWTTVASTRRTPLGKMTSRKLRSTTFMTSLPGAPPGKYFALVYDSVFEHRAKAVETITVALDPDSQWRVSGYFVK